MISSAVCAVGVMFALAASGHLVVALRAIARFRVPAASVPRRPPSLTVLKPLRGDEPGLHHALRSFCLAAWPGLQIVCGLRDRVDPAAAVVRRLMAEFPDLDLTLVIDPRRHGINRKVDNLDEPRPGPLGMLWARLCRDAAGDLLGFIPAAGEILSVRALTLRGIAPAAPPPPRWPISAWS